MNELKDELTAAPPDEWNYVPFTVNHHRWLLDWCRFGDNGGFCFSFVSPKGRRYSFCTEGEGRVVEAEVYRADAVRIARYWEIWGDKPARLDDVLRLTPEHIMNRLFVLLDAIRY